MRRSHDAIKSLNIVENKTTGEFQLPHHVSIDEVIITENKL